MRGYAHVFAGVTLLLATTAVVAAYVHSWITAPSMLLLGVWVAAWTVGIGRTFRELEAYQEAERGRAHVIPKHPHHAPCGHLLRAVALPA